MAGEVLRRGRRAAQQSLRTLADLVVLTIAYWLAFLVRFDASPPLQMWKLLVFTWPYVIALEFAALHAASVTRFAWSYVGLREATRTLLTILASALVLLALRVGLAYVVPFWGYALYAMIPIGVIGANAVLAFVGVIGSRALRRIAHEHRGQSAPPAPEPVPTLLVGAGRAGVLVAKEIAQHAAVKLRVVGFIDDDPAKRGQTLHGIPVLGTRRELLRIAEKTGAKQVVVTMTGAGGDCIRELYESCAVAGLEVKVIPGIYQILEGRANLSRIRSVSIEDLLGREPVHLDEQLLREFLHAKRILVTGAGGSIGAELARQIVRFKPAQLVLFERAEAALFEIHRELSESCPDIHVLPRIGDVGDTGRVQEVFEISRPQVVFHAAAHKHVPMMELNPGEAVKNNVLGTQVVAHAADAVAAEKFVLISTDKAVNPSSVMGATKRVAEMYVQALCEESKTDYIAVRFGNVLGSTGSVLPIFKAQIAEGGPITVTHPDMVRYFMTIPEASQLVMQAAAMGASGQIFVLDMGRPVKILQLATELIRLSGLEPERDIAIEYTGVRPGEKLFEELSFNAENMARTAHDGIFIGKLRATELRVMRGHLEQLRDAAEGAEADEVRRLLKRIVPEMKVMPSQSSTENRAPSSAQSSMPLREGV